MRAPRGLGGGLAPRGLGGGLAPRGLGGGLALLGLGLALALTPGCSTPLEVEVTSPLRRDLQRSFTEPARTRLKRSWTVSMPVPGRLARIRLEPGDPVTRGQVLARLDPVPLEARLAQERALLGEASELARLQADLSVEEAQVEACRAEWEAEARALQALRARQPQAQASLEQAERDERRYQELTEQGVLPLQRSEEAHLRGIAARQQVEELRSLEQAQEAALRARLRRLRGCEAELARRREGLAPLRARIEHLEARVREARHEAELGRTIRAPIAGRIIKRLESGPGWLPAGTRLLEIGRAADLEVVADLLTDDALALKAGDPAELTTRSRRFRGRVRQIEPSGFTKVSSLGIEQQRVTVRIEPERPLPDLGEGYLVEATFLTGVRRGALCLPRFSIRQDRQGAPWVLAVEEGRLRRRSIVTGLEADPWIELLGGLDGSARIVTFPDEAMREGQRVRTSTSDLGLGRSPSPDPHQ